MNERWVYSSGWMRMMAKTKALGEKIVPVPLLFTTNPTWTGLNQTQASVAKLPHCMHKILTCKREWHSANECEMHLDSNPDFNEHMMLSACLLFSSDHAQDAGYWSLTNPLGCTNSTTPWSRGDGVVCSAWWHDCGSTLQKECGPIEIWEDNLHTSTISRKEYFFKSVRWLLPYRTVDRSTL